MNPTKLPSIRRAVLACTALLALGSINAGAAIHPAVTYIKDWLTYPGPDGYDNGMRKSITYHSTTHSFSNATLSYGVPQSSAMSRTTKFLCEYYYTYRNDLTTAQKDAVYADIEKYTKKILQHRKYNGYWGWQHESDAYLEDADLETNKFYHGAIVTASSFTMFTALGNAFACEALTAASKIAYLRGDEPNRVKWINSAKLVGNFLLRLSDPYDYYITQFNAYPMVDAQGNPIEQVGMLYSQVNASEVLYTECPLQNLYAIIALKDLYDRTNISAYNTGAIAIRDQMTIGLANTFYSGYFPKYDANGSGKIATSADYADNDWHTTSFAGAPSVGDDQIEYALAALWKFHGLSSQNDTFTYNNGAYTFDMSEKALRFQNASSGPNGMANYDSYIAFTGWFRKDPDWYAWMPYYDTVGFGLLGELRRSVYYTQYANAWQRFVGNKTAAGRQADMVLVMLDTDLNVYWTSADETSKGTLPAVAVGLSLMNITPYSTSTP